MAAPSVSGGYTVIAECDSGADDDALPSVLTTAGYNDKALGGTTYANTDLSSTALLLALGGSEGIGAWGRGIDIASDLGASISCSGNDRLILCHGASLRGVNEIAASGTCAQGGFRIVLTSNGGTAYRDYYTGGNNQSDFWITEMRPCIIDPNATSFTNSTGTFDVSDIEYIAAISYKTSASLSAGHFMGTTGYLDPYVLTGGEVADKGAFVDFFDDAQAVSPPTLNIYKLADGSLVVGGILVVGDGSTATYFEDSNKTINFMPNEDVSSTAISVHIASGRLRYSLNLGASDTYNVSGMTFTSPSRWTYSETVNASATATSTSNRFVNAAVTLSPNVTHTRDQFIGCGEVDASSGAPTLVNCTIDGGTDANGITIDDLSNVSGLTVQNCTNGIEVINDGANDKSITLNGTSFDGNSTADVTWPGSGTLTINLTNGADTPTTAATGGGTVTIAPTSVDLDLSGMVEGSIYRITRDSDGSDLLSGTAGAAGTASGSFSYSSNTAVTIRVECWDATFGRYKPVEQSGTITLGGLNVVISQTAAIVDVDYKTDSVTGWTLTHGTTSTLEETSGAAAVHTLALVNYANSTRYTTGTSALAYTYPFDTITDTFVRLRQGWTFNAADDYQYLYGATVEDDLAGGDDLYSSVYTNGTVVSGTQLYILQNGLVLTSWWSSGNIDILVKVKASGSLIDSGDITIFAREFGDTYDAADANLAGGGRTAVALNTEDDPDVTISAATAATYTGILVEDSGPYSVNLENGDGANDYDIRIDENSTARSIVYQVLQYRLRRGETTTVNGTAGQVYRRADAAYTNNDATPLLAKVGSNYVYRRGVVPINANTSDLNNWQTTDSSGDTQVPPTQAAITVQGLASGNVVRVWRKLSYASATGNNSGDGDVVVKTTIDNAVPPTGNLYIGGTLYAYTSYTSATFTLSGTLGSNIAEDEPVYVPFPNKSQFTLAASNSSGNSTLVVKETIPLDTPDTGRVRVSNGTTFDAYAYSSYSGSTFTLDAVTLSTTYSEDAAALVGYIDTTTSSTSESVTVKYQADVPVIAYVRDYGSEPFAVEGVFGSSGLTLTAEMDTDAQASGSAVSRSFTFDDSTFSSLGYGRIIDDASSGGSDLEFPKQALYDQIRTWEQSDDGMLFPSIATGSGAVNLTADGASTPQSTGVTCTLSSKWVLKFASGTYTVDLTGPNLAGGPGGRPIEAFSGAPAINNINQVGGALLSSSGGFTSTDRTTLGTIATDVTTANSSLTTIDGKVDTLTTNLATTDGKVDTVTTNLATLDAKVVVVDSVVDGIATTTSTTDGKVDTLTTNLAATDAKVDVVDGVVDGTATKVNELHAIRGLTSGTSTTKTPTGETAGAITLTYTEDGDNITVTRS